MLEQRKEPCHVVWRRASETRQQKKHTEDRKPCRGRSPGYTPLGDICGLSQLMLRYRTPHMRRHTFAAMQCGSSDTRPHSSRSRCRFSDRSQNKTCQSERATPSQDWRHLLRHSRHSHALCSYSILHIPAYSRLDWQQFP